MNQQQHWNYTTGTMIQQQEQILPKDQKPLFGCFHKNQLLFNVYNDKTIEKWDINKFQRKGSPFTGHALTIYCIDDSSDGKYLVSGSADSLIIIYDVKSCNKISTLIGHRKEVNSVQFSSDIKLITTCSADEEIRFWDAKFNKQLENSSFIQRVSFSPDSNQLIYFNNRGQIIFNDLATGLQVYDKITDDKNPIKCMCLSNDGKYLLYSTGLLARIFDLRLMTQLGTIKETKDVVNVGYSSDSRNDSNLLVALPSELRFKLIIIWDLSLKSKAHQQIIAIESQMVAIKLSLNCQYILVASENGNIYTFDPQYNFLVNLIASFQRLVNEIIISPSQRYFTTITNDPILQVLQIEDRDLHSFIKYSIPQKLSFQTLIQDLKLDNSTINSHLGYNLKTIFQKTLQNQRKYKI